MARTYTMLQFVRDWARWARYRDGVSLIPGRVTTPTIEQLLDDALETEIDILDLNPQDAGQITTETIVGVAEQAGYSMDDSDATYYASDLYSRHLVAAYLIPTSTSGRRRLKHENAETIYRWDPNWGNTGQRTGSPEFYTIDPVDGKIKFWPVFSVSENVELHYETQPAVFGLPVVWNWLFGPTPARGRTLQELDFRRTYFDRPRQAYITIRDGNVTGPTAWAAATAYTTGDQVCIPSGNVIPRNVDNTSTVVAEAQTNFTSASTWAEDYATGNWTGVAWSGGTNKKVTLIGFDYPSQVPVTETVYINGRADGTYVPTQSYFWSFESCLIDDMSSDGVNIYGGSGATFDTTNIGASVRTTSLLAPLWAPRLTPIRCAALFRERMGDEASANSLWKHYFRNLQNYIESTNNPRVDQFAYGRGDMRSPEPHFDPWAVDWELVKWTQ